MGETRLKPKHKAPEPNIANAVSENTCTEPTACIPRWFAAVEPILQHPVAAGPGPHPPGTRLPVRVGICRPSAPRRSRSHPAAGAGYFICPRGLFGVLGLHKGRGLTPPWCVLFVSQHAMTATVMPSESCMRLVAPAAHAPARPAPAGAQSDVGRLRAQRPGRAHPSGVVGCGAVDVMHHHSQVVAHVLVIVDGHLRGRVGCVCRRGSVRS